MKLLLVLPIIIPLSTAAACLIAWQSRSLQRTIAIGCGLALLGVSL